ncbi:MAG: adenylate/guanylate cyclase domain-containing protein [Pseudomonadota bacterium]
MSEWNADLVIDWLLEEGRLHDDFDDMVQALGIRLADAGAPICRLRIGMRTLHPLVTAVSSVWLRGHEEPQILYAAHGMEQRSGYFGSPLEVISRTLQPYRMRLGGDLPDDAHDVLHELKASGITDYYGFLMQFTGEKGAILVANSDAPEGFSDSDIAKLEKLARPLAPVVEVYSQKLVTSAIAEAYLGTRTSKLVMDGQITRGDIQAIDAAILVSDLRDWTGLNTRLKPEDAVATVNRYFELVSEAVEAEGGEVLKFIGDGILAIFPGDQDGGKTACNRALSAACAAQEAQTEAGLSFGIGLHSGEVLYGNVGSKTRIDFTVLGQAVNVAARIEGLCARLDIPILFSGDFADRLDRPSRLVGTEILKGHAEPFAIYTTAPLPQKA